MEMVEISAVVTSVSGRMGYLREALESLFCQTRRPDEIVLVLEGEDAGWEDLRRTWPEGVPYRLIQLEKVSGRAAPAKTRGIQKARGRFVVLLDDDDVALPHRIEAQVGFLKRYPTYGWVCGRVERFRGTEILEVWPEDPSGPIDFPTLFSGNRVAYSTVTLTRDAVRKLGAFRDDLPLAPDYEAWLRLTRWGIQGYLMDEVVGRYRLHPSNITAQKRVLMEAVIRIREIHQGAHPDPQRARMDLRRAWRDLARVLEQEGEGKEAFRAWMKAWRLGRKGQDLLRGLWVWMRSG